MTAGQGERGGRYHALQGNERFPDLKALTDFVHSLGLRFRDLFDALDFNLCRIPRRQQ